MATFISRNAMARCASMASKWLPAISATRLTTPKGPLFKHRRRQRCCVTLGIVTMPLDAALDYIAAEPHF
jgi:hypothetical protein